MTGPNASALDGALHANGRVFVLNPAGAVFPDPADPLIRVAEDDERRRDASN